jgi:hypothetical protein
VRCLFRANYTIFVKAILEDMLMDFSYSVSHTRLYYEQLREWNKILLLLLIAIELSLCGSTDKTSKKIHTYTKQYQKYSTINTKLSKYKYTFFLKFYFRAFCSMFINNQQMHWFFLAVYYFILPLLHVSTRVCHHQEVLPCLLSYMRIEFNGW